MEASNLSFWVTFTPSFSPINPHKSSKKFAVSSFSYHKFVDFALQESQRCTHLVSSPLQEKFSCIHSMDGKTELKMLSFEAPKIRMLRSMYIDGNNEMQVLDFGVFPRLEFDLPIFCANFFASSNMNIIVLDLNPLLDVTKNSEYKEKYYRTLMPLGTKYAKLLPWGGKITSESLRFFSPIVIWTKFTSSRDKHDILFAAFQDYYKAWLELMEHAIQAKDASQIVSNREAQHRYLTWRAEKDPGHRILNKLIGDAKAKDVLRNFLFSGMDELGSKTFLDYFPEYRLEDGTINMKRSVLGKSFEGRPWDSRGEFIGSSLQ